MFIEFNGFNGTSCDGCHFCFGNWRFHFIQRGELKTNINHSSTYKTTYMKVKKLKKKCWNNFTMQWTHTWTSSALWDSILSSSIAIKANMLLCCVNCSQEHSIPKDLNLHLSAHTHKTTYMFVICMHDAPKHKYTLNITCGKTWIWTNTNCSKYKKKVCFNYASTTKDIKTITIKSRLIVKKERAKSMVTAFYTYTHTHKQKSSHFQYDWITCSAGRNYIHIWLTVK